MFLLNGTPGEEYEDDEDGEGDHECDNEFLTRITGATVEGARARWRHG